MIINVFFFISPNIKEGPDGNVADVNVGTKESFILRTTTQEKWSKILTKAQRRLPSSTHVQVDSCYYKAKSKQGMSCTRTEVRSG